MALRLRAVALAAAAAVAAGANTVEQYMRCGHSPLQLSKGTGAAAVLYDGSVAAKGQDTRCSVQSPQVARPTGSSFVSIVSGPGTCTWCGMDGVNRLTCWGSDANGLVTGAPTGTVGTACFTSSNLCTLTAGVVTCIGDSSGGVTTTPSALLKAIACGTATVCGVQYDGTLVCWGASIGSPPSGSTFVQVSGSANYFCALRYSGTVACFGSATTLPFTTSTYMKIVVWSGGTSSTNTGCGITPALSITCWGSNSVGQATPPTGNQWVHLTTYEDGAYCAVDLSGTATTCWGVLSSSPFTASLHAAPSVLYMCSEVTLTTCPSGYVCSGNTITTPTVATPTVTATAASTSTATRTATRTTSPTPLATRSPTRSGTGTATSSVTPSNSGTPNPTPSGTPTSSITPSNTPTPSPSGTPGVVVMRAYLELRAPCATFAECGTATGGVLVVEGHTVAALCRAPELITWTAATYNATDECSDTAVRIAFDGVSADWGTWMVATTVLNVQVSAAALTITIEPVPVVISLNVTTPRWGDIVALSSFGLGMMQNFDISVKPLGVSGGTALPCGAIVTVDADTVTCTLDFVASDWVGHALYFAMYWPIPNSPSLTATTAGVFLQPGLVSWVFSDWPVPPEGSTVVLTLPHTIPTVDALIAAGATNAASTNLISSVMRTPKGAYVTGSCDIVTTSPNELECTIPAGYGPVIPFAVDAYGMLTIAAWEDGSALNISYVPPTINTLSPDGVFLPGNLSAVWPPVTFDVTLSSSVMVSLLVNFTVNDVPCTPLAFLVDSIMSQFQCEWDAVAGAIAMETLYPGLDATSLSATYMWGGALQTLPSLGNLVLRPTVTSVAPTTVTPGSVLVIFGSDFCPPAGCSTSGVEFSLLTVWVGNFRCSAVSVVADTAATCIVPTIAPAEAPEFPHFAVRVVNFAGAEATLTPTITYPSSGFVSEVTSVPLWAIPSDANVPHAMDAPITVNLLTSGGTAYTGDITCSLTTLTPGVLIISPSGASIMGVTGTEIVDFGELALQASFRMSSVQLTVTCASVNADITSALALTWEVAIAQLRVGLCGTLTHSASSQATLSAWGLRMELSHALVGMWQPTNASCEPVTGVPDDSGGLWEGPPLPTISCSVTAAAANSSSVGVEPIIVGGVTSVQRATRVAEFDHLSVGGTVGVTYTVTASCAVSGVAIPPSVSWPLTITGCAPGTQPFGAQCRPCARDQYSDGGADGCHGCPETGATCSDGRLRLLPGYFRPPVDAGQELDDSSELHACGLPGGCTLNMSTRAYGCTVGYTGPLCALCDEGLDYARISDYCTPCMRSTYNILVLAAMVLVVFLMLGFYVLRQAGASGKAHHATALRILLTHTQALGALRSFSASGTLLFRNVMAWTAVVSPAVVSQGPTQCAMRPAFLIVFGGTLLAPFLAAGAGIVILAVAAVASGCANRRAHRGVLCVSIAKSVWSTVGARWKEGRPHAILVFVTSLGYMPIISACINVFKCSEPIAGVQYLISDMRVSCDSPQWWLAAFVSGGVLLVFGLGFPLLVFLRLYNASPKLLHNPRFRHIWGFLYDGYRYRSSETLRKVSVGSGKNADAGLRIGFGAFVNYMVEDKLSMVHWESTVLVRKASIVLIASLITNPLAQVTAVIGVMVVFLVVHVRVLPYASPIFTVVEGWSMMTIVLTAALSNLVIDTDEDSVLGTTVTIAMITINAIAVALCFYVLVGAYANAYCCWTCRRAGGRCVVERSTGPILPPPPPEEGTCKACGQDMSAPAIAAAAASGSDGSTASPVATTSAIELVARAPTATNTAPPFYAAMGSARANVVPAAAASRGGPASVSTSSPADPEAASSAPPPASEEGVTEVGVVTSLPSLRLTDVDADEDDREVRVAPAPLPTRVFAAPPAAAGAGAVAVPGAIMSIARLPA